MRLGTFIEQNHPLILQAWEDFAKTVDTPHLRLDAEGLRDHAEKILLAIAKDMKLDQTPQQQKDKSQGHRPAKSEATAAESHGVTRLSDGFTLIQMVSEYRALRASVLRLWLGRHKAESAEDVGDMIRFNEAIDEAIVESVASYEKAVETTRTLVLGVLGHDLRTPLGAVQMGAELLLKKVGDKEREQRILFQVLSSIGRANAIVGDLLDLARSNLSSGIPIQKKSVDLVTICRSLMDESRSCHPKADLRFTAPELVAGRFDPIRIGQVFANLISNAVNHGNIKRPIDVTLSDDDDEAVFEVHNSGDPIPSAAMPNLFNPQGRYSQFSSKDQGARAGLGLGLFIASEIVERHGGKIIVTSTEEDGTTFQCRIPKN